MSRIHRERRCGIASEAPATADEGGSDSGPETDVSQMPIAMYLQGILVAWGAFLKTDYGAAPFLSTVERGYTLASPRCSMLEDMMRVSRRSTLSQSQHENMVLLRSTSPVYRTSLRSSRLLVPHHPPPRFNPNTYGYTSIERDTDTYPKSVRRPPTSLKNQPHRKITSQATKLLRVPCVTMRRVIKECPDSSKE